MPAVPVYARSAAVALPSDLDPARFKATLVVDRVDGKALTAADREALAAALAALVVNEPSAEPAKAASKAPAKGPRKAASARPKARKASSKAPARKAAPPKRKKVSGPPQPEAERKNKLFALRLSPELRATVEARAAAWGCGLGPALVRLVEAGLAAEK